MKRCENYIVQIKWVFLFLCFFGNVTCSWAQTFSIREDFPNPSSANSADAIEYFNDHIVTFNAGLTDDGQHAGLLCYDLTGALVQTVDLYSPGLVQIPGGPNCSTLNATGSELAVVFAEDSIGDGNTLYRTKILVFNEDFDIVKTWSYEPDSLITFIAEVISLPDGGYQIIGWTHETVNGTQGVRVVRFDSELEQQWEVTLPGDFDPWGFEQGLKGYHVIHLENGTSILSCSKRYLDSFDECSNGNYKTNALFILINDQGQELWRDEWDDCYTTPTASMVEHTNGDIYIAHTRQDPEISTSDLNWLDLYLTRYTPEGNIIWEKSYGEAVIAGWAHKIIENSSGELLTTGYTWGPTPGGPTGFLLKTNMDGDSLWMRYHRYGPEVRSQLRDLVEIDSNCFASCGQTYPTEDHLSVDSWVIKFDGLGCIQEGCDVTVYETKLPQLKLFPNPTTDSIQIQGLNFSDSNAEISLLDVSGSMMKVDYIIINEESIEIDLSNISSGIYFIHVILDSGHIGSARFVKT